MKKLLFFSFILLAFGFLISKLSQTQPSEIASGAPPYDAGPGNISEDDDFSWIQDWKRPDGPPKVALQVGHWKNDEVPDELHRLRGNTGASGGGLSEWEVNYEIAEITKQILEEQGITVELLPATVPLRYWADVFVSIHADGHTDLSKTGFKAAAPRRDYMGKADDLVNSIRTAYEDSTGMAWDEETITRNMRGYYAFRWWSYEHAVHPMTTAAILETGFLTSAADRDIIVENPRLSAEGLANGIINYLTGQKLLSS